MTHLPYPHPGRTLLARCLFLSIALLLVNSRAHATTVIAPAFDQLVNQADYVVHAVVKSVNCEWRSSGANLHIVTKVELEVIEVIAGDAPSPLVIEMLGGRIGDQRMVVHGAPEFKVGDEDVLFVHGNGVQASPLVALAYGRYPIKRDSKTGIAFITRSSGESLYDEQGMAASLKSSSTRQTEAAKDPQLPLALDVFASKIRSSRQNPVQTARGN